MKTTSATRFPGARNLFRFIARFFEARRMAPNFAENDRLKMPHAEAGMWNARPHPGPLPRGEGESFSVSWNVVSQCPPDALSQKLDRATATPSPGGEGRGEGERQTILAFELFALRMRRLAQIPALLLLLTLPAVVQAQFNYTTQNGTITITGYTGSGGAVTIPSTINGLPVTSIGDFAFQFAGLTSVTIPDSVTSIGDYAFRTCTSLTNVTIGNSVTSIGDDAFRICTSLTSVTIPNSVTSIGNHAFSSCTSLSAITVDTLNSFYRSVAGVLFNNSQTTLIQCPGGKAGSYTIPNSVTRIGVNAFVDCTSLTSVTIPNSVTSIGGWTFSYCSSLTSVSIGNSVTRIADYAFVSCSSLTGVYFQGNAPSVGSLVFSGDNNATIYYLPWTAGWGLMFGGRPVVLWNPPVPYTYTTNNSTITITKYFGSGGAVTIPDTIDGLPVTSIGYEAFFRCTSLTSVTIPNSVANIGSSAFYSCTSLTNVTIPNSVTSIGDNAFSSCSSLTSVTIGNSVTSIGSGAFSSCTSLTVVYFQGNAPSVGSSVFDGASNAIVYYLPGTTGWGPTFAGRPAVVFQDADGDGMPDGWEVDNGLNPRVNDTNDDLDLDGLTNLQEYQMWSTNHVQRPDRADSLGDGRSDYERFFGSQTNRFYYDRTDRLIGADYNRGSNGFAIAYVYDGNGNLLRQKSLVRDANHNGLPDVWEFLNGLTNNASAYTDTDGDSWTDYQEWKAGTNPRDAASRPGLLGNPGINIAALALPFTPSNFVVGVGQLDGLGAEEIVIGADGNPGTNMNFLLVLTQGPTSWS
ncbi:MAG: leucine-rich repeat domain-containing protein, partial [Verrucomicrobiota bacterium]